MKNPKPPYGESDDDIIALAMGEDFASTVARIPAPPEGTMLVASIPSTIKSQVNLTALHWAILDTLITLYLQRCRSLTIDGLIEAICGQTVPITAADHDALSAMPSTYRCHRISYTVKATAYGASYDLTISGPVVGLTKCPTDHAYTISDLSLCGYLASHNLLTAVPCRFCYPKLCRYNTQSAMVLCLLRHILAPYLYGGDQTDTPTPIIIECEEIADAIRASGIEADNNIQLTMQQILDAWADDGILQYDQILDSNYRVTVKNP